MVSVVCEVLDHRTGPVGPMQVLVKYTGYRVPMWKPRTSIPADLVKEYFEKGLKTAVVFGTPRPLSTTNYSAASDRSFLAYHPTSITPLPTASSTTHVSPSVSTIPGNLSTDLHGDAEETYSQISEVASLVSSSLQLVHSTDYILPPFLDEPPSAVVPPGSRDRHSVRRDFDAGGDAHDCDRPAVEAPSAVVPPGTRDSHSVRRDFDAGEDAHDCDGPAFEAPSAVVPPGTRDRHSVRRDFDAGEEAHDCDRPALEAPSAVVPPSTGDRHSVRRDFAAGEDAHDCDGPALEAPSAVVPPGTRARYSVRRDFDAGEDAHDCDGPALEAPSAVVPPGTRDRHSVRRDFDAGEDAHDCDGPALEVPIAVVPPGTRGRNPVRRSASCEGGASNCDDPTFDPGEDVKVRHTANRGGKRKWDKQNVCVFCLVPQSKLARHVLRKHKDEFEIQEISSLPVGSKERKSRLQNLVNRGNFVHNTTVLKERRGSIIPWRRPPRESEKSEKDMLPCSKCMGFFTRTNLFRHKCHAAKSIPGRRVQSESRMMLPATNDPAMKAMLSKMRPDNVTACCTSDKLIMEFAAKKYRLLGHEKHQHAHVRDKIRELGRLMMELKKEDEDATLEKYLHPSRFEILTSAVRNLTQYDGKAYGVPSLALKIGHSLNDCASVLQTMSIVAGDPERRNCAEGFKKLYANEWRSHVSARALGTLHERRWNRPACLPLTEDVQRVHHCIAEDIRSAKCELQKTPSIASYATLAEATLAQITLFNRRRPGETSRLTVAVYADKSKVSNKEIVSQLSPLERQLCDSMQHVVMRGKRGRPVPLLLNENMVESLDMLVEMRDNVGIDRRCPYIFVRSTGHDSMPLRGSDAIRTFSSKAHAANVNATACRKHVATMMQLLQLKNNEEDTVARFLGHDIRVHREFYRLPEKTIQVAKVTKLLLAMEQGITSFGGKTLDEIDPEITDELDIEADDEFESEAGNQAKRSRVDDEASNVGSNEAVNVTDTWVDDMSDEDPDYAPGNGDMQVPSSDEDDSETPRKENGKSRKRAWTPEEKDLVKKRLKTCIKTLRCPRMHECQEVLRNEPLLRDRRSWRDVKYCAYNIILSYKKRAAVKI